MVDKIVVFFGGIFVECEVLLNLGVVVLVGLCEGGVDVYLVDLCDVDIIQLKKQGFKKVFIVFYGCGGEDGILQGLLELIQLFYIGSGVMVLVILMDKLCSKWLWQGVGLLVVLWVVLICVQFVVGLFIDVEQ